MSRQANANPHTRASSRFRKVFFGLSFAILIAAQSIGCSAPTATRLGFGEALIIGYRDTVWAKRAYNLRYGNCERPYEEHFRAGFCAGFISMANGEDGYVPALPPQEYRGFEFQSADGTQCVNSWFEGYPEGVAAAKKEKVGTYHDVLISRMIDTAIKQDNAQTKIASDIDIALSNQVTEVPIVPPTASPGSNKDGTPPIIYPIGTSRGTPPALTPSQIKTESSDIPLPMAMPVQRWNEVSN